MGREAKNGWRSALRVGSEKPKLPQGKGLLLLLERTLGDGRGCTASAALLVEGDAPVDAACGVVCWGMGRNAVSSERKSPRSKVVEDRGVVVVLLLLLLLLLLLDSGACGLCVARCKQARE